eukprot:TRINITY_DN16557_c0_g1_i2.p1 TRINITY_DN16557_c0_g1~~TRINITY_DN16557_c0_g1_i2.p1  ORF type:complete len:124 (+),score=31.86 TRINITY_DN16557_c0_g1_i2:37-408(+)
MYSAIWPEDLEDDEKWKVMVKDKKNSYYLSQCWKAQFYSCLCYKGFVSIAQEPWLIPELQYSYAVLDFENLHLEKSLLKRVKKRNYVLKANTRSDEVFWNISRHHPMCGSECWLGLRYREHSR